MAGISSVVRVSTHSHFPASCHAVSSSENSFDRLPRACAKRFAALIRRAQSEGARVVCLTPQPLYGVAYHDFGSGEVRCYNIDASTMKTMLRANNGMVLLEEGVIRAKKNCRDIRP